jgi:hypothetical protein
MVHLRSATRAPPRFGGRWLELVVCAEASCAQAMEAVIAARNTVADARTAKACSQRIREASRQERAERQQSRTLG